MIVKVTYDFREKTILITGGAGDIGRATAQRFAPEDAGVVLLNLNEAKLADASRLLAVHNSAIATFHWDVADPNTVAQAFEGTIKQFGQSDYVFNNAGYQDVFAKTDAYPTEDFQKVMDINVMGIFHVLKVAAQHLQAGGGGAIVNMASHAGVVGLANLIAYSASKFAVIGMTQTAAKDLAPDQIRVNALSPA